LQETSNAQEHNQETSMLKHTSKKLLIKQNYKKNVWHWTLDIQSAVLTIQIRYKLFETLEFLRYELWKEILSELLDAEQFWQSFGAFKLLQSLIVLKVFTPLYRGVKWTLSCQHIQKESFEAFINHQLFIAWYGYCPMKDQFQMHSMYEGTLLQAEVLSLSCTRDKLYVVEIVVVHFVQLYFVNA